MSKSDYTDRAYFYKFIKTNYAAETSFMPV